MGPTSPKPANERLIERLNPRRGSLDWCRPLFPAYVTHRLSDRHGRAFLGAPGGAVILAPIAVLVLHFVDHSKGLRQAPDRRGPWHFARPGPIHRTSVIPLSLGSSAPALAYVGPGAGNYVPA